MTGGDPPRSTARTDGGGSGVEAGVWPGLAEGREGDIVLCPSHYRCLRSVLSVPVCGCCHRALQPPPTPPHSQSCGFGSGCCEDSLWLPQGLGNLGEDRSHSLRSLLVAVGLVGRVVLLKLKGLALEAPLGSGDVLPTVLCCQLPCVVASHPNIRLFSRDVLPGLGGPGHPRAQGLEGQRPAVPPSGHLAS